MLKFDEYIWPLSIKIELILKILHLIVYRSMIFYSNEKRRISMEFRNTGSIEYTFRLSSTTLKTDMTELDLPIKYEENSHD